MRKLVIQTRLSKRHIEKVLKRVNIPFTVNVKRGQLYVFLHNI